MGKTKSKIKKKRRRLLVKAVANGTANRRRLAHGGKVKRCSDCGCPQAAYFLRKNN